MEKYREQEYTNKEYRIRGTVLTPEGLRKDHELVVCGGQITGIRPQKEESRTERGPEELLIAPGLIDIHSDMIEHLIQPRSTAMLDMDMALEEAEKQLAACGITTIFHSVSMFRKGSWDASRIRTAEKVQELAEKIVGMRKRPHLIHNRYHLRYEIDNLECYGLVHQMLDRGLVQLLSLMDHRPLQGQYRDLNIYRRHLPGEGKDLRDGEFDALIRRELEKPVADQEQLAKMTGKARALGISVSSHDDDCPEKIKINKSLGVRISEFPITMETALEAKGAGMYTLLGAPNILQGGSHSGNLSAELAVREGCADILCSDYYPQALLRSVLYLWEKAILPPQKAWELASLNPAKAVGIGDRTGSLEVGKQADFLVLKRQEDRWRLMETWCAGACVQKACFRECREPEDGSGRNREEKR